MPTLFVEHLLLLGEEQLISPKRQAALNVFITLLIEKFTQEVGQAAVSADISFKMVRQNHNTVRFSFTGYDDVLPEFVRLFMQFF